MNILLINHYAGSIYHGMEYRPYYLAREWQRLGHSVTIVASSYSHVRNKNIPLSQKTLTEYIDGICYIWFKTPKYNGNGISRVINIFSFVINLYANLDKNLSSSPDLIIASSTYPLDTIPARKLASKYRARLIYEVHDLWPLSLIELGGMSKSHPFIRLIQWSENFAYKKSDIVVSLLPEAKTHMIEHGMSPEKFRYIPNGIDITEWEIDNKTIDSEIDQLLNNLKQQGYFLVVYAGSHGIANSLDSFIDAGKLLVGKPVRLLLVGQGPEKDCLIKRAAELNLDNVIFLPSINKKAIPYLLSLSDAAFISLKSQPLFRFGVSPNKLMDYMMAAKPIIYAIDAGNDPVSECNCGISVPPDNPLEIANAITNLMSITEMERNNMGKRGRDYVTTNHVYQKLASKFIADIYQ